MGYESRVYVVNEWDDKFNFVDKEIGKPLGEIIAKFDLCCVENGFLDVFKDEAKCYLYESNGEMFSLYDIMAEYNLTYNEICELLENVGELTGEDTIGIICALDNIYNGEEE